MKPCRDGMLSPEHYLSARRAATEGNRETRASATFDASRTVYEVATSSRVLTLRARASDPNATLRWRLRDRVVNSAASNATVGWSIDAGENPIHITVLAEDGATSREYIVAVART